VEGENSTSGPQPYRAEITNQITPEIPTVRRGQQFPRVQLGRPTLKLGGPCKVSEHGQVTMRIIPLSCATGNVI